MSASRRRLLVVGASGLLGTAVVEAATGEGHRVLGAARRVRGLARRALDLTQREQIDSVLDAFEPEVVVLCSAYPHVDGCEADPARSTAENVQTVANVIQATHGSQTKIVFFSTDQVFDGALASYQESDAARPLNVYARHKREAEKLLLERGDSLIVRSAWIFGEELDRKNFMYRVIAAARASGKLIVPADQVGCPTWSRWLAESALLLLAQEMNGIVHLAGSEALSKAEWARLIVEHLGLAQLAIGEVSPEEAGQVAPRPQRVVLRSQRHSLIQPALASILSSERRRFLGSSSP